MLTEWVCGCRGSLVGITDPAPFAAVVVASVVVFVGEMVVSSSGLVTSSRIFVSVLSTLAELSLFNLSHSLRNSILGNGGVGIHGGNVIGGLTLLSIIILSLESDECSGGTEIGVGLGLRPFIPDPRDEIEVFDSIDLIPVPGNGMTRMAASLPIEFLSSKGERGFEMGSSRSCCGGAFLLTFLPSLGLVVALSLPPCLFGLGVLVLLT